LAEPIAQFEELIAKLEEIEMRQASAPMCSTAHLHSAHISVQWRGEFMWRADQIFFVGRVSDPDACSELRSSMHNSLKTTSSTKVKSLTVAHARKRLALGCR
jgi:hypothetical protein